MAKISLEDFEIRLRERVRYDPETGRFSWLVKTHGMGGSREVGDEVGHLNDQGYRIISMGGRLVRAHRAAFFLMAGVWPPKVPEPDHENGQRDDNCWGNLRLRTRSQNNLNSGVRRNNVSGVSGVSWAARRRKWVARITVDGVLHSLGEFDDKEAAVAARREGEKRLCPDIGSNRQRKAVPRRAMAPA